MSDEIQHHGTKGMKWGVRRFQNKNGSLKPAGKKREKTSLKNKETAKKVGKEANRKLPNAAVGMAATIAINSVIAAPAAMVGRQFLGGTTGAVLGVLAANTASVNAGIKIYDQLMDNGNKE